MTAPPVTSTLTQVREAIAAALAPLEEGDPYVHANRVDAVEPPALMLDWDEPWLMPGVSGVPVMGPCHYDARIAVFCLAARLSPAEGIVELERLVAYVVGRLEADGSRWKLERTVSPAQTNWGGIDIYEAALIYVVNTPV